jgi:hypothetical protein
MYIPGISPAARLSERIPVIGRLQQPLPAPAQRDRNRIFHRRTAGIRHDARFHIFQLGAITSFLIVRTINNL